MDMCNEHSKSPRKLWSLLNSLTGRVKSHLPPRATLISLSETFAAIISDPSRPVHLVQTAETETRCTSEPSQERRRLCQFSPVSVQMVQNLLQNIDSGKATGADNVPGLLLKKCAPNLAPSLTAIFIASFAAGELPQAFKQADIYKSGDRETASTWTINRFLSFPSWASFLRTLCHLNAAQSFPGQQQSSSWNPVCLPRQPLDWRCPCIYCESLTAGERLWKGNWLSLCRPEQGVW